jgi:proteasome lid subunit RPN8/RPN11
MSDQSNQLLDPARDIGHIDYADWPARALPASLADRRRGFQVVIEADALKRIHKQGRSNLKAEVGGVLVGNGYQDDFGPYLLIDAIVEGRSMRNHAAQVTFTAETWADIQLTMDRHYPDSRIVGWYHTHPGFGIFLSEMDLFIQDNFFNLPWQTALVYDPKSGEEGVFIWHDGRAVQEEFLTLGEKMTNQALASPLSAAFPAMTFAELANRQLDMERRLDALSGQSREMQRLRRRNRRLMMGLFILVFALTALWTLWMLRVLPPDFFHNIHSALMQRWPKWIHAAG